jgi:hypothetical protein
MFERASDAFLTEDGREVESSSSGVPLEHAALIPFERRKAVRNLLLVIGVPLEWISKVLRTGEGKEDSSSTKQLPFERPSHVLLTWDHKNSNNNSKRTQNTWKISTRFSAPNMTNILLTYKLFPPDSSSNHLLLGAEPTGVCPF